MTPIDWAFLGRVPYPQSLALQNGLRDALLSGGGRPSLMLLEHPPTVTLGRRGADSDLRCSREELAERGVYVAETDRGGQATVHGPGQLVGYPILNLEALRLGPRDYVLRLAAALRDVLALHAIDARWREDAPGLWVDDAKIVAIGVHVHRGITTHGFALNVQPELSAFDFIVPCGQPEARATSMAEIRGELWSLDALSSEVAAAVARALGREANGVPAEVLLRRTK